LPSDRLRVRPANPFVNSAANEGPGCLEPEGPPAQISLI
jgi:hypothetical protein